MNVLRSVEFTIRVDYIESINNYLVPIGKGQATMSAECRAFKMEVKNQLARSGVKLECAKNNWFQLSCAMVFKCSFGKRDSNNCIKILVDAVCEFFGLNDNHLIYEEYRKMWRPGKHEYIKCKLDIVDLEEKDFKI